MAWGTLSIGGVEFREEIRVTDEPAGLRINGQDSHPPQLKAAVEAAHLNVRGAEGLIVPVVFGDKAALSGFYEVTDARSEFMRHAGGAVQTATWSMVLERIGTGRDIEVESTVPRIARPDTLAGTQTAVFWQAPPAGYTSIIAAAAALSTWVDRPGMDGIVRVFTSIPNDRLRWTVRADDYARGGARVYFDTFRRLGTTTPPTAVWELHNGLVRITPDVSGSLTVTCWDNGGWRSPTTWRPTAAGDLFSTPELTVIRNAPEEVAIRLSYPDDDGRITVDLSLRRGARTVSGVIKRNTAATIGLTRAATDPWTVVTGGLRQTTVDADGNRWIIGSSTAPDTPVGWPYLVDSGVTRFDFFVGHEVGAPTAPVSGDAFADLLAQYLGSTGERVRVVYR